jgi:hypothetical protein
MITTPLQRSRKRRSTSRKRLTLEPVPRFILLGMDGTDRSLRCGEVAHLTGVSPDTIRHYERIGISGGVTADFRRLSHVWP